MFNFTRSIVDARKDKLGSKSGAVGCCNWRWMEFMSEGDNSAQETTHKHAGF